jgi:putative spermidine/putrescine transport system substrate-binding protein
MKLLQPTSARKRRVALVASIVISAAALVTLIIIATTGTDGPPARETVVIAEFGGAYSKSVRDVFAEPFAEQAHYDARVVDMGDFGTVVAKIEAMVKADNPQWDIVELLGAQANELVARGAVETLPADVRRRLQRVLNPGAVEPWGVSIASFTELIACNRSTVERCPRTPAEFFDTERFPGRRALGKDNWLNNCALALTADGVLPKRLFPMDIARCLRKMETIKDRIAVFYSTADQMQQLFRDREIDIALGPDGRLWNLVNEGMDLSLSYRGALYQSDYFVVIKGAKNRAGALDFLSWYATHPRAQARFAVERVYGMPNPLAYKYIPRRVARQLVDFPANKRQTTAADYGWVRLHGADAARQWASFLAE